MKPTSGVSTAILEIPLLPTSKNPWTRMHWAKRARIKAEWAEAIGWEVKAAKIPSVPRITAHIRVLWDKPGTLPDWHNLEMAHEVLADTLCPASKKHPGGMGIIPDDSNGQYVAKRIVIERGCGMTEVELTWEETA